MPRVRPYESQVSSQGDLPRRSAGPQDFGGAGLANLGQGVQNLGQGLGQAQRILQEAKARQEVTDAQVSIAELGTTLTKRLDEAAKAWTPDQPPLSETFLTGHVKTELDRLRTPDGETERFETAYGQNTFKIRAQALTSHMTDLTRSIDAKLAGEAAVTQHRQAVDTAGNFLQSHPAYFKIKREEVASIINDPNGLYGRIPAVDRQKLTRQADEQLAISAVQGFIRKSPNVALETLRDPLLKQDEQYGWMATAIPNEKLAPLINQAETEVRAREIENNQAMAEARRQQAELQHTTSMAVTAAHVLHIENPNNPNFPAVKPSVIAQHMLEERLSGPEGRAILNWMDSDNKERVQRMSTEAYDEAFNRLSLPWGHPDKLVDRTEIYNLAKNKKLTPSNVRQLLRDFDLARSSDGASILDARKNFLTSHKSSVTQANPLLGKLDSDGDVNFGKLHTFAANEEERLMKANINPHNLYDDTKPEYLGNRLQPFVKPIQESMRDMGKKLKAQPGLPKDASGAVSETLKRLPGETPEQYDKRTGR